MTPLPYHQNASASPLKILSSFFIIFDYYLAAILLLWAGISKLANPGVGDLLESLLEHNVLTIDQLIFISRWFPPVEIILALLALSGIKAGFFGRTMAFLYLFFTLLLIYAAGGYLLLPIDCGCFGEGSETAAYILVIRNCLIALPLFFLPRSAHLPFAPAVLCCEQEHTHTSLLLPPTS